MALFNALLALYISFQVVSIVDSFQPLSRRKLFVRNGRKLSTNNYDGANPFQRYESLGLLQRMPSSRLSSTKSSRSDDRSRRSIMARLTERFLKSLWKGLTLPFPALRQAVLFDEEISTRFRFRESLSALFLYLASGAACYHYFEPSWTVVDAVYFTVTCFTTVGYGDLCPSTVPSKIFTCVFGVSGICFLGAALAAISSKVVQKEVEAIQVAKKESADKIKTVFEDHQPSAHKSNDKTRRKDNEIVEPGRFADTKKFLSRVAPPLFLVLAGGVYIYNLNHPGPDPVCSWVALYYAIVTASTIGFGDIHPSTRAARICAIFYIPIAVAAAGELLSSVADRVVSKRKEMATKQTVNKGLTLERLLEMDKDGDGKVTQDEFVQHMLVEMGLVQTSDIEFLKGQFKRLDITKSGYLDRHDLREKAKEKGVKM